MVLLDYSGGMSYTQFGAYGQSLSQNQILMNSSGGSVTHTRTCCESGRTLMTDPHTGQQICSCQYTGPGGVLSYNRTALSRDGVYNPTYGSQGYVPGALGTDPSAFYSPLNSTFDGKDSTELWRSMPTALGYGYDSATLATYPYTAGYGEYNGTTRRKNATRETTGTLKAWLNEHKKNPYPTKGEKIMLAIITKMSLTQVSTWFANARRRLKKENKMTWVSRTGDELDERNDNDCTSNDGSEGEGADKLIDSQQSVSPSERVPSISETSSTSGTEHTEAHVDVGSNIQLHITAQSNGQMLTASDYRRTRASVSPLHHSPQNVTYHNNANSIDDSIYREAVDQKPKIWSIAQTASTTCRNPSLPRSPISTSAFNVTSKPVQSFPDPLASLSPWTSSTPSGLMQSYRQLAGQGSLPGQSALTGQGSNLTSSYMTPSGAYPMTSPRPGNLAPGVGGGSHVNTDRPSYQRQEYSGLNMYDTRPAVNGLGGNNSMTNLSSCQMEQRLPDHRL